MIPSLLTSRKIKTKTKKSVTSLSPSLCLWFRNSRQKANFNLSNCSESVWLIPERTILSKKFEENLSNKPLPEHQLPKTITLATFSQTKKAVVKTTIHHQDRWAKNNSTKLHSKKLWNKLMRKFKESKAIFELKKQQEDKTTGILFMDRKYNKLSSQIQTTTWIWKEVFPLEKLLKEKSMPAVKMNTSEEELTNYFSWENYNMSRREEVLGLMFLIFLLTFAIRKKLSTPSFTNTMRMISWLHLTWRIFTAKSMQLWVESM